MATSGQQVSLEQESPLFEVLAGVLSDWELNGYNSYIWDDDTISKLRDRVYTYSVRLDERVRKEREVMRLFLQQGKKYCKALFTATSVQASIPDDSEDIYSDGRVSPPPAYTPVEAVTLSATGPVQSDLVDSNRQVLCPIRLDPSSIDPYNVVIDGLAEDENPHAYVTRVHEYWRELTNDDGTEPSVGRFFLRSKLASGLPKAVQNNLRGVVGLEAMTFHCYRENIIHFVNQHRQKLLDGQVKAAGLVRQLNEQMVLLNGLKLADLVAKSQPTPAPTGRDSPNLAPRPQRYSHLPDSASQQSQARSMVPPSPGMSLHLRAPLHVPQPQRQTAGWPHRANNGAAPMGFSRPEHPRGYSGCYRCGSMMHRLRDCPICYGCGSMNCAGCAGYGQPRGLHPQPARRMPSEYQQRPPHWPQFNGPPPSLV